MGVKSPSAEYRQSVCVSTKKLLWRVHESDRVHARTISQAREFKARRLAAAAAAEAAAAGGETATETETEAEVETEAEGVARVALATASEFRSWLVTLIRQSLYPGSPFEREVLVMELLLLLLNTWPWQGTVAAHLSLSLSAAGGCGGAAGHGSSNNNEVDNQALRLVGGTKQGRQQQRQQERQIPRASSLSSTTEVTTTTTTGNQQQQQQQQQLVLQQQRAHPLSALWTEPVVLVLANLLLSSWDRVRTQVGTTFCSCQVVVVVSPVLVVGVGMARVCFYFSMHLF
jgi:hypothetical protein